MIEIRACEGLEELEACVRLQIETWGYDESDVVPRKAFLVAQKIGGQVIGAFDTEIAGGGAESGAESLVGFAFSLPGVKTGRRRTAGLSALAYAGGERGIPESRAGRATQAGATA